MIRKGLHALPATLAVVLLTFSSGTLAGAIEAEGSQFSADLCQSMNDANTIRVDELLVNKDEIRILDGDTIIVAGRVTVHGALLGAPASSPDESGSSICIRADELHVTGLVCAGPGYDRHSQIGALPGGEYAGRAGSPGGTLGLDVPAMGIHAGSDAVLCSGTGGDGESILAFDPSFQFPGTCTSTPGPALNVTGGAGGDAGDLVAARASLNALSLAGASVHLGDGGPGGDVHILYGNFAGGTALGGAGGSSGGPDHPAGQFLSGGTGGRGGDAVSVPCPDTATGDVGLMDAVCEGEGLQCLAKPMIVEPDVPGANALPTCSKKEGSGETSDKKGFIEPEKYFSDACKLEGKMTDLERCLDSLQCTPRGSPEPCTSDCDRPDPCENGGCERDPLPCEDGGCYPGDPCENGGCEPDPINNPCEDDGCEPDDPCENGGCEPDPINNPCEDNGCNPCESGCGGCEEDCGGPIPNYCDYLLTDIPGFCGEPKPSEDPCDYYDDAPGTCENPPVDHCSYLNGVPLPPGDTLPCGYDLIDPVETLCSYIGSTPQIDVCENDPSDCTDPGVNPAGCLVTYVLTECYKPVFNNAEGYPVSPCGAIDGLSADEYPLQGSQGSSYEAHGDSGANGNKGEEGNEAGWSLVSTTEEGGTVSAGTGGVDASISFCKSEPALAGESPDIQPTEGAIASAGGGIGGEGHIKGGRGGDAYAQGGTGGDGGDGGDGGFGLLYFCPVVGKLDGADGGVGDPGAPGGEGFAVGGRGGHANYLLGVGGDGGDANGIGSNGGDGGNGGNGGRWHVHDTCLGGPGATACAVATKPQDGQAECGGHGGAARVTTLHAGNPGSGGLSNGAPGKPANGVAYRGGQPGTPGEPGTEGRAASNCGDSLLRGYLESL